jgi:hypothetical protein
MDRKKSLAALVGAVFGLTAARFVDLALIGGSIATAAGAVGLAGYMTLRGGGEPHINGMRYLAIFAQPSHRPASAETNGVDMNPVGAIAPALKTDAGGYALVGAKESYAWLREGNRIFAVRPGDEVPRLGHVASIQRREGRWALIDDKGAALIASAVSELEPSADGHFDKSLIFGKQP